MWRGGNPGKGGNEEEVDGDNWCGRLVWHPSGFENAREVQETAKQ